MMEAGWTSIPVHDHDPLGGATVRPAIDGGDHLGGADPAVGPSGEPPGLEATAEQEHARFISALAASPTLAEARDHHLSILAESTDVIQATREAVAAIPTMEVLAAHLEGASLDGVLRIPMSGVGPDGIALALGSIDGGGVLRLSIDGGGAPFERLARIDGDRTIEAAWLEGGALHFRFG